MNMRKVWLVFRKDWLEVKRNWQVLLPIIIVPLIFAVVLPSAIVLISGAESQMPTTNTDFQALITNLPLDIQAQLAQMSPQQVLIYIMTLYFFAPFFLIIPVMASSVMGSDSFAGERERKTIEALLATPISDSELLMGKILVSFIPAMIITFVSFAVYTILVDAATFSLFNGTLLLPNLTWLLTIFGVAPTIALFSIGLTVIISAKVKGFKEAQQISVILLLPILGLVFAQIAGVMILGPLMLALIMALFILVDAVVFYVGVKMFQREEILSKPA
ncbi:MAG: ABC transporter permease subunit [Candidatus Bathyarchaeota archaeon]|nr:ABC transporter permease subunit [Candidatus Bathyarchaeota archaeon]